MVVKKNEKKRNYFIVDDIHSIKDLIEDKRKEIRELELQLKSLPKVESTDNEENTKRGSIKRQIKRLEKEIKALQRKL